MKPRILSTSNLVGPALADLGNRCGPATVLPFRSPEWYAHLPEAEALIVLLSQPLTAEDLDKAPALRVLGTYSVGVNHLPGEACRQRGIPIIATPGVLTDATADIALALLLAVSRRVAEGERLVRSGSWAGWAPDQLLGIGLAGKHCGILGSGPIGRAFARRVWALGMEPTFWDREGTGAPVDFGAGTAKRLPLEELLPLSDVLSLHCPLTPATRGLLDRAALLRLPPNAIVINTSRGGILDEGALREELHAGHLGGVGLDVYDGEPEIAPAWLAAPRTVLLPHLGSATLETRSAMARVLCEGIASVLAPSC